MTTRKRLLALIVLLLLACRLPYAIGRRLSSSGEPTPSGTAPAVSINPEAGTAVPTGLPYGLPGGSQPYPGRGAASATSTGPAGAGVAPGTQSGVYPGVLPGQSTPQPGVYPGLQNPSASVTAGLSSQSSAATETVLPGDENPAEITPLPTVLASPTPYLTPTPTLTHTPTVTPTPLPPPAWSRANLQATDPRTVKLASGKVQLVEFFAFWSGPSQAMSPLVQGVESEYGERVNFVYLDVDDPAVATFEDELGYDSPPHFFLLAPDGTIIDDWVGYISLADLRAKLESALNP